MVNKNKRKSTKTTLSYEEERELRNQKVGKIIAWVLLIIMSLTVVSWSMLGTPTGSSNGQNGNVPYTQNLYQNPTTGDTYDGARIDGVDFIFFESIREYVDNQELISLKEQLTALENPILLEYIDTQSFSNDDARFLVNQGLGVNGITTILTNTTQCESPTLIYTTNVSNLNITSENCIVFESAPIETFSLANGLTYHLIKDLE